MELQKQYSFFPLTHTGLYQYWLLACSSFWVTAEIDFSKDKRDYDLLDKGTQNCITSVLAFFAQSDGLVCENLSSNFMADFSFIKDCIPFYSMQQTMELVHNETYSTLIDILISDTDEKARCFNAMSEHKTVSLIGQVIMKWMQRGQSSDIAEERKRNLQRLIAFICTEGLMFIGSFVIIFWIKTKNIMTGLTSSNELISRDETMHTKFGIALYRLLVEEYGYERLSSYEVNEIIAEFIEVASLFVRDALCPERCASSDLSITSEGIIEYLKLCADNILTELGYDKVYHSTNPFAFMLLSGMHNKSNFFEKRVTSYKKPGMSKHLYSDKEYV